jgi:hypothetical protein
MQRHREKSQSHRVFSSGIGYPVGSIGGACGSRFGKASANGGGDHAGIRAKTHATVSARTGPAWSAGDCSDTDSM